MFIDNVSVQQISNLSFNFHNLTFGQLGELVTGLPHSSCGGQLFLAQTDEQTKPASSGKKLSTPKVTSFAENALTKSFIL